MSLVSSAEVIAWATPGLTGADTTVLDACIAAAQSDVEKITGFAFTATQRAEYFNGTDAFGKYRDVLVLGFSPILFAPPTNNLSITEDGVTLTVQYGWQATAADVTVRNVNMPAGTIEYMFRNSRPWSEGRQNILVNYWSGFDGVTIVAPPSLVQIVKELAWLYYKAHRTIGSTGGSAPSRSTQNPGVIPESILTRLASWRVFR